MFYYKIQSIILLFFSLLFGFCHSVILSFKVSELRVYFLQFQKAMSLAFAKLIYFWHWLRTAKFFNFLDALFENELLENIEYS